MDVKLYPGNYRTRYESSTTPAKVIYNDAPAKVVKKAIAFDLDETLGEFSDLFILWNRLNINERTQSRFNEILDIFPEFVRSGIIDVLRFVHTKLIQGECLPVYIYTNNQCESGPDEWVDLILTYFETKVDGKLFARPIRAYKIGGRQKELKRTTHEKTYDDFVQCSMLEYPFELCFVDDRNYKSMRKSRVYYIQPPPYFHGLSKDEIETRFLQGRVKGPHTNKARELAITKKIMYYLREYFIVNLLRRGRRGHTKRRRCRFGTRRRRHSFS
jgi:hypothetical protein